MTEPWIEQRIQKSPDECVLSEAFFINSLFSEVLYNGIFYAILITLWRFISMYLFDPIAQHFADINCPYSRPIFAKAETDVNQWKLNAIEEICIRCDAISPPPPVSMKKKKKKKSKKIKQDSNGNGSGNGSDDIERDRQQGRGQKEWTDSVGELQTKTQYTRRELEEYRKYRNDRRKNEAFVKKYSEECWKATTTTIITAIGIYVMTGLEVFYNPAACFTRWPQNVTPGLLLYYRVSLGYHIHRAIMNLIMDTKRKDRWAMFVHHWVTVFLISGSYGYRCLEFGGLVMVTHDNADMFLSCGKVCIYSGWKKLTDFFFVLFASSWLGMRLVFYLIKVLIPVSTHGLAYSCHYLWHTHMAGLYALYALHVWWSIFLIKMIWHKIRGGNVSDSRSDSEDKSG